jgi:hypothetical protein
LAHAVDPATATSGGNAIQDQNLNLHHEWDDTFRPISGRPPPGNCCRMRARSRPARAASKTGRRRGLPTVSSSRTMLSEA